MNEEEAYKNIDYMNEMIFERDRKIKYLEAKVLEQSQSLADMTAERDRENRNVDKLLEIFEKVGYVPPMNSKERYALWMNWLNGKAGE